MPDALPGPADVAYFTQAQAGAWGDTLAAFAAFAGARPGGRVLDVGTGPGLLLRLLTQGSEAARLALGCDDSWAMARRAMELSQGMAGVAAVTGSALRLPLAEASFDAVLATNLLFLLPDPSAGLGEMVRVARIGATVAFLNPSVSMGEAAAAAFADARGWSGFRRFSFVNYGRLAQEHCRLSETQWSAAAQAGGLQSVRSETRAGGLIVFVAGRKEVLA